MRSRLRTPSDAGFMTRVVHAEAVRLSNELRDHPVRARSGAARGHTREETEDTEPGGAHGHRRAVRNAEHDKHRWAGPGGPFAERYGVAAINVVDDLTLEAVLAAATELEAPLIVQTSVKTVKAIGADSFYAMWRARADDGSGAGDAAPRPLPRPRVDHDLPAHGLELGAVRRLRARRRREHASDHRGGRRGGRVRRPGRGRDRERPRRRGRRRLRRGGRGPSRRGLGRSSSRRPASTASPRRSAPRTASTRPRPS